MSIGLKIGPIEEFVQAFKLLFPVVSSWLEIESDAEAGFREPERVAGLMEAIQSRIAASLMGQKVDGTTMGRSRFSEEIREIIVGARYRRPNGVDRRSVRSLKSYRRLEMIWDMNIAQARGYAKWLADMTPEALENEPCYELVRIMPRQERRDWPLVWADHGGKFYGTPGEDYPNAPGRMIAKKTDPVWRQISIFETPWTPFDWGSGMGLAGIDIDEAEDQGVVSANDPPQDPPINFKLAGELRKGCRFTDAVDWFDLELADRVSTGTRASAKQGIPDRSNG